jgi:hypothetical protein
VRICFTSDLPMLVPAEADAVMIEERLLRFFSTVCLLIASLSSLARRCPGVAHDRALTAQRMCGW